MRSKKILVTGAAGFIGSHLIPLLIKEEYDIIALDKDADALAKLRNEGVTKVNVDICDHLRMDDLGNKLKFDSIIHLAAMAAPRIAQTVPEETFKVNVYGTYNVFMMAKKANVKRVIVASTAHVYGISPKYMPTNEVHPLALQDIYTNTKIVGEHLCRLFFENHNISYVVLRMFNGYGPGQSLDYFIPAMISQAMEGGIRLRGRHVTKDFIYVGDMVEAMVRTLRSGYIGPLNVGTGVETTLEYIASYIADAFNVRLTFSEVEDKGPTRMQCDPSRLKATLEWSPTISMEEGLSKTITSFKKII